MGGAQNDVERVRKLPEDRGERVNDVLDALVRREEPEGEDHRAAFDPEPVLAPARRGQERNAMRDEIDLVRADAMHVPQERPPRGTHDDEPLREGSKLVHHAPLQRIGLGEDGVQRRDDRHPELAQELKDVAPGLSTEDSVLVLDRDDVDRVDVQEVRGAAVRRDLALGDLEPNARRVCVAPTGIVHREDEALDLRVRAGDGAAQIRRERRNSALTRQVIAEHRDLSDRPTAADCFD